MTFGEKLQSLRKQKNMTQEQLALQLEVSRQAISKWELDSSLPDIENVLQLSKLFEVSTDYLLKDEVENESEIFPTKPSDSNRDSNSELPFVIGACFMIIGLLISITGWNTYQTELAVGIGIIVQIGGVAVFELLQSRYAISKNKLRHRFYTMASWLLTPFVALYLSMRILGIYPRPYSHWMALVAPACIYVAINILSTFILMAKPRTKE